MAKPREQAVGGDDTAGSRKRSRRQFSTLAFAAALLTIVIGSFATFGGISYAASSARQTVRAAQHLTASHSVRTRVTLSSASAQYNNEKPLAKKGKLTPHAAKPKPTAAPAPSSPTVQTERTLPFTGISLAGTLAIALGLIGLGIVLRRHERRRSER